MSPAVQHVALTDARGCSKVDQYSPGELLSAAHAVSLYTIMRLIGSGTEYFVSNRETLTTMAVCFRLSVCPSRSTFSHLTTLQKIAIRFDELYPRVSSPFHQQPSRTSWEEWMLGESRRR